MKKLFHIIYKVSLKYMLQYYVEEN